MKIGKHKVVNLTYELKLNDNQGELVQKVDKDRPFVYLFGVGGLLPLFEQNLEGKVKDDKFEFSLTSDEGYGPLSEDAIVALEKNIFEVEGKIDEEILQIGNFIPMQNDQGQPLNGKVIEIKDESVIMDFNHPLAGKDLYFTGEILEVREASEEEMSHGHAHGPDTEH
jgi:FKBP-type peptidyl-prolyl cis-trans isomerase SlyD